MKHLSIRQRLSRALVVAAAAMTAASGLSACGSAGADDGKEVTTIRYQSYAGAVDAFLLADALGEFEGLTLKRVGDITGGPQALQALVSNQTDIGGSAFYGAIAQLVATGAPIKAVIPVLRLQRDDQLQPRGPGEVLDQDGARPRGQEDRGQHARREPGGRAGHLVRPAGPQ